MRAQIEEGRSFWVWDPETETPASVTVTLCLTADESVVEYPDGLSRSVVTWRLHTTKDGCIDARAGELRREARVLTAQLEGAIEQDDLEMARLYRDRRSAVLARLYRVEYQHSQFGRYP